MFSYRQKQWEQSESRISTQRGELSAVRETHHKGEVERQLLEREKDQLSEALSKVIYGQSCSFNLRTVRILCAHVTCA